MNVIEWLEQVKGWKSSNLILSIKTELGIFPVTI